MSEISNTLPTVSPAPSAPITPALRILAILGAVFGGFILLSSACGIIAYLVIPLQRARAVVLNNTLLASLIALGLIYGALIFGLALSVLNRRPWPRFSLPPASVFIAVFFIVIGIGQAILSINLAPAYLFPPWHVLASAMLPLATLAYAVRRLPAVSSASAIGELAWGGVGTILLSVVLELIAGGLLLVAVVLVLVLVVGPTQLQQLGDQLQPLLQNPDNLDAIVQLLTRQPALIITVGIAAVVMLSVLVPLIEETLKSLGPAIAIGVTKPPITRALLWGIASGAGYAFSENLLNGATALSAGTGGAATWALPMTLRAGTSLVHIATTATISLGWYGALVHGQRARFFLYLLAGLAAHGLWNFISVIPDAILTGLSQSSSGTNASLLINALQLLIWLILGLMIFAAGAWIVGLIRWAKRMEGEQAEVTNPQGLEPAGLTTP